MTARAIATAQVEERPSRPRLHLVADVSPRGPRAHVAHVACRVLNVVVALIGLVVASPVMLAIAFLIKATSRGPVLYRQRRVGRDRRGGPRADDDEHNVGGKPFTIFKFRTMRAARAAEQQVWASRGDPRVTRLGRVLRATRLDELPQLVNVLRGDMNVVGPRPEQVDIARELRRTIPGYALRHRVLPGITGLAQTTLGYDQSLDDVRRKIALDLEYVRQRSPINDLRIMARTPLVMLGGRGAL
jgi:lipopolysaccharide/colanic/teichoic acid biosynthesis glycosyltransferase